MGCYPCWIRLVAVALSAQALCMAQPGSKPRVPFAEVPSQKYPTIAAALKAVDPGGTIIVRPGKPDKRDYVESLKLDRSVTIRGEDDPTSKQRPRVVFAGASCVRKIGSGEATIENLDLICKVDPKKGRIFYGIDVQDGSLVLKNCTIESECLAGVAVHETAKARLHDTTIQKGNESGLLVYDKAFAWLQNCTIANNALFAIEIRDSGHVDIRRGKIQGRDGPPIAIAIATGATGTCDTHAVISGKDGKREPLPKGFSPPRPVLPLQLTGHGSPVTCLAFSRDEWLASGDRSGTVRVWNVASGARLDLLSGLSAPVAHLAFMRDGALLLGFSEDGKGCVWELPAGNLLQDDVRRDPQAGIAIPAFTSSASGKAVATVRGNDILLWKTP